MRWTFLVLALLSSPAMAGELDAVFDEIRRENAAKDRARQERLDREWDRDRRVLDAAPPRRAERSIDPPPVYAEPPSDGWWESQRRRQDEARRWIDDFNRQQENDLRYLRR